MLILYLAIMSTISCSQTDKTDPKINGPILTAENYIPTMLKEIKRFPKEPVYRVYVKNSLCLYEILVNDYPVAKSFNYAQEMTPYNINIAILQSGKQKITLRIYPPAEEYSRSGDTLSPNTSCKLEIESIDNIDPNHPSTPVAEFKLPTKIRKAGQHMDVEIPEFEGTGKKYYEIVYEFEAAVPYRNEGWIRGQNLYKVDRKKLEEAALKLYQNQWNSYKSKNADKVFSFLFQKETETTQASYADEKALLKIKDAYMKPFTIESFVLEPIQEYDYKLFGDGKLISLQQKSTDPRLRSNSALWGKYKNEKGSTIANFRNYYLYLPDGKKLEDGLEVIR